MSLYAFHIGQVISAVVGQVDHVGQDGNAARTPTRDETSGTDHTKKRPFRHGAVCRTIKALAILGCLYDSEMVLLGVVIRKCETPTTPTITDPARDRLLMKREEGLVKMKN